MILSPVIPDRFEGVPDPDPGPAGVPRPEVTRPAGFLVMGTAGLDELEILPDVESGFGVLPDVDVALGVLPDVDGALGVLPDPDDDTWA